MSESAKPGRHQNEIGIGLIEIVVSMFLLALAAATFLPVLIYTVQLGPKNAAIAAGNQLVADGLTRAETNGLISCAKVRDLAASFPPIASASAPALEYDISVTVLAGECSSGLVDYPRVIDVHVKAVQHASSPNATNLADAHELIYVALP